MLTVANVALSGWLKTSSDVTSSKIVQARYFLLLYLFQTFKLQFFV